MNPSFSKNSSNFATPHSPYQPSSRFNQPGFDTTLPNRNLNCQNQPGTLKSSSNVTSQQQHQYTNNNNNSSNSQSSQSNQSQYQSLSNSNNQPSSLPSSSSYKHVPVPVSITPLLDQRISDQQQASSSTSKSQANVNFPNPASVQSLASQQSIVPRSHTSPPEMPTLQNIVSTVNLGIALDLKSIATKARNAEYNPKRFAAVIMRIRNPRTTALIFSTGKMVCTGAKSVEFSRHAARKFARIIQKLGYDDAKFLEFKVQNMVGSVDVKFPIRLEGLVIAHSAFTSYEPELFPGLIYRMVKPKIVLLIFVSGKVVLTGAKHEVEIQTAYTNIYPVLRAFKKPLPQTARPITS